MTFIRYRRKSTEGDERQIASLTDQATALDELEARLSLSTTQIADDVEESKSAKQPWRPGFNTRLIGAIHAGKADAVLCWHADRLSRNAIDTAALVNLMDMGKLKAIITHQQIFWNTPMDKFMLALLCGQAKLENDNKGINVKRGLAGKIRKGWRPGIAPIGYLNDKTKERGERTIIIDQERFPLIRKLWNEFLTGNYSVRQIQQMAAHELNLRTRATKKQGSKPMTLSHVYRTLTDPFYYGWFWWKKPEAGEKELKKGNHFPMITEGEYRRAQMLLGRRELPAAKKHLFAYRGLIRCGECGSFVTAEEKWQVRCDNCGRKFSSQHREACPFCDTRIDEMEGRKVQHYVYYHCTKKKNSECHQRGIRIDDLEVQIDGFLKRFNIGEKYMQWAIETLKEETEQEVGLLKQTDGSINKERKRIKEAIAELNRFIVRQENAGWTLMKKEDALTERNRLEQELLAIEKGQEASNRRALDWFDSCVHVFDYACHARFWFEEGNTEQKRAIFSALGSNLILKDKKLSVEFTFPLKEIEHMVEIAPEITAEFEPAEIEGGKTSFPPYEEKIPALLRSKNAIRTYFVRGFASFPRIMEPV